MKHDFEEFFPLPWGIKHRQQCYDMGYTEDFFMLDLNSKGQGDDVPPSLVDFTARGGYDHLKGRDDIEEARKAVLAYIVTCANLMPEAVEVLNEADDHMGALLAAVCDDCPKLGTEDCEECPPYKTLRKIGALLAKLEGGAEDA